MIVCLVVCLLVLSGAVSVQSVFNSSSLSGDEFLKFNQKECFRSRSISSCVKYKIGRTLWKLATNSLGYFPSENSRDLTVARTIRLVHLAVPSDTSSLFDTSSRNSEDDSEFTKIKNFLQRTAELFARNHGFQIQIPNQGGTSIIESDNEDDVPGDVESRARVSRGDRKKRKWLLILPLIILMKIAHLKMTVVPLLLATLGLNVLLIGGGGWIIHYLKYKTLCKIHPHFIQSHSHVYDSDPNEYSSFLGSSSDVYSSGIAASGYYAPHEKTGPWNTRKNFHAYGGYKA